MDLQNVKLVVSDMDGTLLNSQGKVSPHFFELYTKLQQKNITFCAASGRQHSSIVSKLCTIKNQIFIIAENGGIAKKAEKVLVSNFLEKEKILKLIPILRSIVEANIVLCGDNNAYIESKDKRFINLFKEYYYTYKTVQDLVEIAKNTPLFKIAVYHFNSSEDFIYPIIKHLEDDVLIKISGKNWLDISDKKANKGNALRTIQKILNVSKEETIVFGDYHNDIEMMQAAKYSFAMKNAHPDIKKLANYITESNDDLGVEKILKKLVNL